MKEATLVRLEPLWSDDGREGVKVTMRHGCEAHPREEWVSDFSLTGGHRAHYTLPCGCQAVVPLKRWQAWVGKSDLGRAIYAVRGARP